MKQWIIRMEAVGMVATALFFLSCQDEPQRQIFNVLSGKDRIPPVLMDTRSISGNVFSCVFSEPVTCSLQDAGIAEGIAITAIESQSTEMRITLERPVPPGTRVTIRACVSDAMGNTLHYSAKCWGKNEHLPRLVINEFSTKGTASNPDRVEILALSDGNLAGVTFYEGIGYSYDSEFIFPAQEIHAGDCAVLYFGHDASEGRSLGYFASETGLGGNNGVLTLCDAPSGGIVDAVLYSDRTAQSDTSYGGFGTRKVQQRADLLEQSGAWIADNGGSLRPESGIDSTFTTSTRSFCRNPGETDTDTRNDWHIVPTGAASFGEVNTTEVYEP